jgi:uncharacterized protein (UPF0276 family)
MTVATTAVASLPRLGSGLGYRVEMKEPILAARGEIDFLELLTDQFLDDPRLLDDVRELCDVFPVVPHGIGLSVGSAAGLDLQYVRRVKAISDVTGAPYYSEHLCTTRAPGLDIGHLSPLAFTHDTLERTVRNVLVAQEVLEKPLVLENVTYLFAIPEAEMTQAEFFRHLVEATDCGVLLDVTNVHINSVNHGYDPVAFLDAMPLDRVVQVHLAGGYWSHEVLVDSHSETVQEESWQLFEALVARTDVRACILEHDANFPSDIGPLTEQVRRARSIMDGRRAAVGTGHGGA